MMPMFRNINVGHIEPPNNDIVTFLPLSTKNFQKNEGIKYVIGQLIRDDLTGEYVMINGFDGDKKSMIFLLNNKESLKYNKGKRRPWEITRVSKMELKYNGKI